MEKRLEALNEEFEKKVGTDQEDTVDFQNLCANISLLEYTISKTRGEIEYLHQLSKITATIPGNYISYTDSRMIRDYLIGIADAKERELKAE